MKRCLFRIAVATTAVLASLCATAQEEKRSTLEDQQSVAVTIYNENLALVKDTRRTTLNAGDNRLALG